MIEYRTSSFCSLADCVEVGFTPDGRVVVRDSKEGAAGPLVFTREEWVAFTAGVRAGEFGPV